LGGATQRAEVSGDGTSVKPEACALGLPLVDILKIGLACGSASATTVGGNPSASAVGKVAGVDLSLNSALGLLGLDGLLTGTIQTVEDTLCGPTGLVMTLPVGGLLCPVVNTATGTVTDLLNTKTLDVVLGQSTVDITTDGARVVAKATANGGEIRILPLRVDTLGINLGPLATITIGSSTATAEYNRSTGKATPTFNPSLVTIKLGATALLPATTIDLPVGVSETILAGTPLESDIVVAAGRSVTNADGTVSAISDGVRLHLLKGLSGGIELSLAHAEAGAGGSLALVTPVATAVELPRTGGTPWIPVLGAAVLGLAVLVRRTVLHAR
ncbi:MAG: LPXTG cell wall anchor domain-containing protein, partial [Acidimicrobiales bacterium]